MSREIEKKATASFFEQVQSGQKTFDLRLADWDCQPGDTLVLVEVDNQTRKPTGRTLRRRVGVVVKTKDLKFWSAEEVKTYGYQAISLIEETV
jgi:hypothetical protein